MSPVLAPLLLAFAAICVAVARLIHRHRDNAPRHRLNRRSTRSRVQHLIHRRLP